MSFRYELSPNARVDILRVIRWLFERSPEGAVAWTDALYVAIERVTQDPFTFSKSAHRRRVSLEYRTLTFHTPQGRNYHLAFAVEQNVVRILRVRSPGQRPIRRKDLS
jgi:plasmid stabilization system protein ParE